MSLLLRLLRYPQAQEFMAMLVQQAIIYISDVNVPEVQRTKKYSDKASQACSWMIFSNYCAPGGAQPREKC